MSKTLRGRRWTGWSKRQPSLLRPFPVLRVEELEARTVPAQFTWTGAGLNNNWTTGANWIGGVAPTGAANDSLSFPGGGVTVRTTNNDITNGTFFSITIDDSNYTLGGKSLTLGSAAATGNISVGTGVTGNVISLNVVLAAGANNKQFFTVGQNSELTITGKLSGTSGSILTKDGNGILILDADNSAFTGDVYVNDNAGPLEIRNVNALGDAFGDTTVGQNATLQLRNVATVVEPLILNGPGVGSLGALRSVGGIQNRWAGTVLLDSNATVGADVNTTLRISGPISDSGSGRNLVKEGLGEVILSSANSYRGTTTINEGTLTVAHPLALGTADKSAGTGTVVSETLDKAGQLRISSAFFGSDFTVLNENLILNGDGLLGGDQTVFGVGKGSLYNSVGNNTWAGPVALGGPGTSPLVNYVAIGAAANTDLTISGIITPAVVTPTQYLLQKVEPGRVIFNNRNTYNNFTAVLQGVLNIRDSGALGPVTFLQPNSVFVTSGATLQLEVEAGNASNLRFGYNQTTGGAFDRDLWDDSVTHDPNKLLVPNDVTIAGLGLNNLGALHSLSGINRYSGNIVLSGAAGVGVAPDARPGHPTPTADYFTDDYSLTPVNAVQGATLVKRDTGHLILEVANTYGGQTLIQQGWVTIRNANSLSGSDTVVSDTAALHIYPTGASFTINQDLTLTGNGITHPYAFISGKGALMNLSGNNSWGGNTVDGIGDIVLAGTSGIGVEAVFPPGSSPNFSQLTINTSISQSAAGSGLDKWGSRRLVLLGDGTYSGAVNVNEGILRIGNDTALGWATSGTFNSQQILTQTNTTVAVGGALELQNVSANNNGGISSGIQVADERLVLNGQGQQLSVAGDVNNPNALFTLTYTSPIAGSFTTVALHITATAQEVQDALNFVDPITQTTPSLVVTDGQTAVVTRVGNVFRITFGDALQADVPTLITTPVPPPPGFTEAEVRVTDGGWSVINTTNDNSWRGPVTLAGGSRIGTNNNTRLSILGAIDDAPAATPSHLTKRGLGDLALAGSNTYRGQTFISEGVLTAMSSNAFGFGDATAASGTTIADAAQLQLNGGLTFAAEALTVQGTGTATASNLVDQWFNVGPSPTNNGQSPQTRPTTGRITSVAADPNDANTIYVATAGGGVWKTKNGGLTWHPLFDDTTDNAALMYGSYIAVSPTNPSTLYLATGEPNGTPNGSPVPLQGDNYVGTGVYRSIDSGRTWALLTGPNNYNPISGQTVTKLLIDPMTANRIYVATSNIRTVNSDDNPPPLAGVFRYEVGAGATWVNLTSNPSPNRLSALGQAPYNRAIDGTTLRINQAAPQNAGPDDDYRLRFPDSTIDNGRFAWSDIYLVRQGFNDPFIPRTTTPNVDSGGVNSYVLYAALSTPNQQGFTWTGTTGDVPTQGIKNAIYRTEDPFNNNPTWWIGNGSVYPIVGTAVTLPDQRGESNYYPIGNVTAAGGRNEWIKIAGAITTYNTAFVNPVISVYGMNLNAAPGRTGELLDLSSASANGGITGPWVPFGGPAAPFGTNNFATGYYDAAFMVPDRSPGLAVAGASQVNTVYLGGRDAIFRTTAAPTAAAPWVDLATLPGAVAPAGNFHSLFLSPASQNVLSGSDGGIWSFNPTASSFSNLNGTLAITQFNSVDPHPTSLNQALAGSYNNGIQQFGGSLAWNRVNPTGGDNAGVVRYDPKNPLNAYSVQNGVLYKTNDGGVNWNPMSTLTPFFNQVPLVVDAQNPQRIVAGGWDSANGVRVLRQSLNGGSSFSSLNLPTAGGELTSIALATYQGQFAADARFPFVNDILSNQYDRDTIYATNGSRVDLTKNSGQSWATISPTFTSNQYVVSFDNYLKYRNIPQITFVSATAGVSVTTRTALNGSVDPTAAVPTLTGYPQTQGEVQVIEVARLGAASGTFTLRVRYVDAALGVNIDQNITLNVGDSQATVQAAINGVITAAVTGHEIQELRLTNMVFGSSAPTMKVQIGNQVTADITLSGGNDATNIQTAINALTSVAPNSVVVTFVSGTLGVNPVYRIVFSGGAFANTAQILASGSGSGVTVKIGELQKGGRGTTIVTSSTNAPVITSLTVSQANRDVVFATVRHPNNQNGPMVLRSTDAGVSWTDISGTGTLPNASTWTSAFDPRSNTLYIGSDKGVYRLSNAVAASTFTWSDFSNGLENVQVHDLVLNQTLNTLTAATYGRGMVQLLLTDYQANSGAIRAVSGSSTWNGPVVLAGNTRIDVDGTQNLQNGIAAALLDIVGTISDGGNDYSITKEGQGTLILSGANTYGGLTDIQHGVLRVSNPSALGESTPAASANTIVRSGAALELTTDLYQEPVTVAGPVATGYLFNGHGTGAIRNVSGFNTYTGTLTMMADTTIGVNSNTQLTIGAEDNDTLYANGNGSIVEGSPVLALNKELTGTLVLGNANTYNGGTNIIQGALRVAHANALGTLMFNTQVYDGAQVQISRNNVTHLPTVVDEIILLSGTGINGTGAMLNVRGDSAPGPNDNTWRGLIQLGQTAAFSPPSNPAREVAIGSSQFGDTLFIGSDTAGGLQELGAGFVIDKVGPGRVTFVRANNYTGQTNVIGGTLRIMDNDSLGSTGAGNPGTVVSAGATLELDGTGTDGPLNPTELLTINGDGSGNVGALNNAVADNSYTGAITIGSTLAGGGIGAAAGTTLTILGALQDPPQGAVPTVNPSPGQFRKLGDGTVVLPNPKTYSGLTLVSQGILNILTEQALGTSHNEVQFVQVIATSGSFALSFKNQSTIPIRFDADPAEVKAALESLTPLSSIGATVSVAKTVGAGINTYRIEFDGGPLRNTDQPDILPIHIAPTINTTTQGTLAVNEVQTIQVVGTAGTYFALTYNGLRTDAIPVNSLAGVIETALEALGTGDITVAPPVGNIYQVTFNTLGNKSQIQSLVVGGTTVVRGTNMDGQRGTTVQSGATLQVAAPLTFDFGTTPATSNGELITLNGQGFNGIGALQVIGGNTVTFNVPLLLGSDASVGVQGGGDTLVINSVIAEAVGSGSSGLDIYGLGVVVFTGNGKGSYSGTEYKNYYTGTTTVNSGTLLLSVTTQPSILGDLVVGNGIDSGPDGAAIVVELVPNQVEDDSDVFVKSDGTFDLNGLVDIVGDLDMVGGDVFTQDNGQLTTRTITMTNGAEIHVGNDAKLTGDDTSMTNSNIHVGTNSTVTVNGNLDMDNSGIDFLSPGPGTLNVTGNLTMLNGSLISFNASPGILILTVLDLLLNSSTIDLNDASSIAARNVTLLNNAHIDFDNNGKFTATGNASVSSGSDILFDNDGRFDIAGSLTLNNGKIALGPATALNTIPPLTPATTVATLTTGRIDMTGGTSEINIGNSGYLTANGPVTNSAGDILFGTDGTFRAVGTVGLSAGALVQFGLDGLFDNQSFDLTLDNSTFVMADNGMAKTFNATLANGSEVQFADNGTLEASGNLTMTGLSQLTFVDNGHATTNNIAITGGKIEFRDRGLLEAATVVNTSAAISFGDSGEFDAADVTVRTGGTIGFGGVPSPTYTVAGGQNGKFNASGAVSLDAAQFWMGIGGQARLAGLTLTNTTVSPALLPNSTVIFDNDGTLTIADAVPAAPPLTLRPLTMNAGSEIRFGLNGTLVSGDLTQNGGIIDFLDGGTLDPANVILVTGTISFDDNGTFLPNNLTANNSFVTFGNAGTLAATGSVSFAKTELTMGTGADVDMLALNTTGATKITLGDNSTIDAGTVNVGLSGAVLDFGENNTFTTTGNVSITSANGVTFDKNGKLIVGGDLTLNASPLDFAQPGLVQVAGNANLVTGAKITFADQGTFHTDGDIILTSASKLVFANKGVLETNDLSVTAGTITMGSEAKATGTGGATIASSTVTLGANSTFDFASDVTIAPSVPPAGTPALTIGDSSTIKTGKLTVTSGNLTFGATSTATTGDILTSGSKITVGAGTTVNAANVSSTGTTWTLNNNDTLNATGNVKFENHGTVSKFGTGVTIDADGDFTLNNASVTFGVGGKVAAEDVFITKAKLTFGNNGTLLADGPLHNGDGTVNLNNTGGIIFGDTGSFSGGKTTLVNSSVSGGKSIVIDLGSLDMDPSTFTLGAGSNGTIDGDVDITDGAISMGANVDIVVTGKFANNRAAVTFGNSGSLAVVGNVSVLQGSTTFGGDFEFSAADVTLTSTALNQGDSGKFTARDLTLQDASLTLGTSIVGSIRHLGMTSGTAILGASTNFAITGDITADSSPAGVSTILGDGAIDFGNASHGLAVGNGDLVDGIDFSITADIVSTPDARLVKTGAGRVELAAPSGSVVDVTIATGDVQVTSSAGDVVLAGGTISGIGSVASLAGSSGAAVGVVAPGNNWDGSAKAGILTTASAVWGPQTTFNVDLSSSVIGSPQYGLDYDTLRVSGNIDLGNAVLAANYGTNITLDDEYLIVDATGGGSVSGKFKQFNNQDILFVSGQKFDIVYTADTVTLKKVLANATVTILSNTPNPSTRNQTVTLVAQVEPELGASLFSGTITVSFYDNGNFLGSDLVDELPPGSSQFFASITTTSIAVGNPRTLTAVFDGDADNFASSTSLPVSQIVQQPYTDPLVGTIPACVSPNNSTSVGVQDTYSVTTTARDERGTITWNVVYRNPSGTVVRTIPGSGNPGAGSTIPIATTWDGRHTDGTFTNPNLVDGLYTATLTVTDSFGNVYSPPAISFTRDNTTPTATLPAPTVPTIDPSANPSPLPKTTTFNATVGDTNLSGWVLSIRSGATLVRSYTGTGPAVNVTWDGKDGTATPVGDGAYTVTLTANDLAGNTFTTAAQTVLVLANGPTVTLSTGPNSVYGTSYTLTATVSLPVGAQPSEVLKLAGGTVEFFRGTTSLGTGTILFNSGASAYQATYLVPLPSLGAGTYSFSAAYTGSVFPQGQPGVASHTIDKAPLDIVIQSKSRLYGAADPVFTFTVNTPVNGDSVAAAVTGSPSSGTTVFSNAGTYVIGAGSLAPTSNYTINSITTGTLTIGAAPIRIQIDDKTRPVNTANPVFTYTVLDLLNGDPQSSVSALPMGTTAGISSPVGSYPITATGAPTNSPNYVVTQILPGTLSVTPVLTNFAVGNGASVVPTNPSLVNIYAPNGNLIRSFTPFGSFSGGIRTAVADFNGDGVQDTAVATGPGAVAQVSVFSGSTGLALFNTFPFDEFTGGVFVAAGDINGDGIAELVLTPDQGGGPRVLAFQGGTFNPFISFFGIDDPDFRGGARAGVGDMNGDGFAEIAVSAGFQGGPRIAVWDGAAITAKQFTRVMPDFFAYSDTLRNGAYVAIGDVNGDGKGDLITGAGPGGAPHVKIFSGESLLNPAIGPINTVPFASFFAGDSANRGGVRVASKVFDNDLFVDLITGAGDEGGDRFTTYFGKDLKNGAYIADLDMDFPGTNNNGVFVG